jgi:hypothetical protein
MSLWCPSYGFGLLTGQYPQAYGAPILALPGQRHWRYLHPAQQIKAASRAPMGIAHEVQLASWRSLYLKPRRHSKALPIAINPITSMPMRATPTMIRASK